MSTGRFIVAAAVAAAAVPFIATAGSPARSASAAKRAVAAAPGETLTDN